MGTNRYRAAFFLFLTAAACLSLAGMKLIGEDLTESVRQETELLVLAVVPNDETSHGAELIGAPERQSAGDGQAALLRLSPTADELIVPVTADENESDILTENEQTDDSLVLIEEVRTEEHDSAVLGAGPHILVYHTHTTEAYRQEGDYTYEDSGNWRTSDTDKNIVAVGSVLTEELEKCGFGVIHDTTDHEPPKLSTSYSRSLDTMLKHREDNDSLSVFIDVHRDAYGDMEAGSEDVVIIDGKRCARIMFVVGKGAKYESKPDFESNYALAAKLTQELESYAEGFTRDVRVKTGRYNQHVSDMCLLVEIGHNANTLEEAMNSAAYLARAVNSVVRKMN